MGKAARRNACPRPYLTSGGQREAGACSVQAGSRGLNVELGRIRRTAVRSPPQGLAGFSSIRRICHLLLHCVSGCPRAPERVSRSLVFQLCAKCASAVTRTAMPSACPAHARRPAHARVPTAQHAQAACNSSLQFVPSRRTSDPLVLCLGPPTVAAAAPCRASERRPGAGRWPLAAWLARPARRCCLHSKLSALRFQNAKQALHDWRDWPGSRQRLTTKRSVTPCLHPHCTYCTCRGIDGGVIR